ncbi:hypothetical protein KORDIASMS9_03395 [Kordia sp. SMS9]|uniref:DUF5694 domain-containing protein n=1 Tax=Kordia sp. SMS9 TaxID=2282170 RepID=UPI000E0D83C9|nr:DUF5694 domain-containing protein [Kordia sp. SMS9]AXG71140.1 hypothetical protein KORDIASMS9_03395 [Kordia sp. SMS9]
MKEFTQIFISIAVLSVLITSCGQESKQKNDKLETEGTEKIKVYLLGTFHFAQTDSTYNVLDTKHQKSIEDLCEIIANQKPDKIFVERQPEYEFQNKIDSLYNIYIKMSRPLKARNEIYQVGFRAAKKLGHKKVFQCDHPGQYGRFNRATIDYATKNNQTDILEAKRLGTVMRYDDTVDEDSIMNSVTLLEYIQWINSPEVMTTSHASYLTNYPQIGSNDYYNYDDDFTLIGAELTADWYNRNIMIYSKMINQVEYENDKSILLLMGADHIPIIKSFFDANPYFKVEQTSEWLK